MVTQIRLYLPTPNPLSIIFWLILECVREECVKKQVVPINFHSQQRIPKKISLQSLYTLLVIILQHTNCQCVAGSKTTYKLTCKKHQRYSNSHVEALRSFQPEEEQPRTQLRHEPVQQLVKLLTQRQQHQSAAQVQHASSSSRHAKT